MARKDIKLRVPMETVSFCLLPVIATGHRLTTRECSVTTGVLRLESGVLRLSGRVIAMLTTCTSLVLTAMSIVAAATTGGVCGLSQNNKCSLTSIRVYTNGAKTERIKIFSGAF